MKAIRYLSPYEMIKCIRMLRQINIEEKIVEEFIVKSEKYNKNYQINPIIRYVDLRDKIKYYQDNEELQALFNELEIFLDIFASSPITIKSFKSCR